MEETLTRLLLIGGFLMISFIAVLLLQRRASRQFRRIDRTGLAPGIHFFSSGTCAECTPARMVLVERLGANGFVEHTWEADSAVLEALGIDAVPATLVVDKAGAGKLWTGMPNDMFSIVDP